MDNPDSRDWAILPCLITDPDAAALVEEVQLEYVARYGGRDDTPLQPGYFEPPAGGFFVGYLDGVPVATGAWRRRHDVEALGSNATAEIKRMYVVPVARGLGLARAMLAHLEQSAAAAGTAVMILETGSAQPEAIALYTSAGYTTIPGFGHYRDSPLNRCLARAVRTTPDMAEGPDVSSRPGPRPAGQGPAG